MKKKNETVHLLILDESQNDAEHLVSLLRNSGRATRAHRVTSLEDLTEHLNTHSWDLFLAREEEREFDCTAALTELKRLDKDIPFIILSKELDKDTIVNFMKAGAQDVVPFEYTDHLMLVISRELKNLYERRQRKTADIHLHEAEKRCELLLDSSKDAIAYVNDGMHIYANQSYLDFLGYEDMDEMMCIPILDTMDSKTQEKFKETTKGYQQNPSDCQLPGVAKRSDDHEIEVSISLSSATYDGEPCMQVIIRPQTSNAELEEKLKEISSQDLLTGLYNRQHFMEQLTKTVESAHSSDTQGALLYIVIDEFNTLKSDVGIAGTDLILSDISAVLKDTKRTEENTHDIIARLGDDTFAELMVSVDEKNAMSQAELIRRNVEEHLFEVSDRTIRVTVSIGVALINENAPKSNDLIGRGHVASADVKKLKDHEKGNGIHLYVPKELGNDVDNSSNALQKALDENRFKTLYQPIISLRGEGEEHYEAFIRMLVEDDEEVSPYDFLPPSGPSDMATKIDRWVILKTIKTLGAHRAKGHQTKLFLNITAETILDQTFLQWLSVALKAARLPGDAIIFQITETDAVNYLKQAKGFVKHLKQLHCKLSISRFGCALDPFNTLKHLDADYVKLDGSFTEEIQQNEETREQVKEMIQSLQGMGKLTIVPLVENASVLSTLWQAGVNYIQGYYLQAPTTEMNYDFSEEQ
ncbi:response regulator receiver and PAS sensor-containing signal transduction histidine kinase/phosphodiesterase [Oleiphilus messinensis]|uniref:Response regulator receiver and PAS sensor-containing signal transduction histidine kinase/phosphodiesterase n=1 Tax=Oleiphilus messinensis TaxID=141451 RepID=A0A1Y0I7Z6_9GAMM|nr:EAL domain-containing protein [Oleiphilus messinensis]ARU55886.1 response regulator receiver and PAS sensor-containing signal transduction histidine kinase/phosphodiesterase [Oleiphilus messinensis]